MSFKNINNLFIEERVINLKANLCLDNKEKSLKYINKFHSSEIASYLQLLDYNDRKKLIKILSYNFDPKILVELESSFLQKIIDELDIKIICKSIKCLDSDEASSIIKVLDTEKKKIVFSNISKNIRNSIEKNLSYARDSAGRLMQCEIVRIPSHFSIKQTLDFLQEDKKLPKVFYDLFIVNENGVLTGTVPLSVIVSSSKKTKVSSLIKTRNDEIHFSLDQEEVADIFRKRNLTSLAVVDEKKKLLGVINVEDIVDVIDTEADEDFLKLGGVGEQSFYDAVMSISKARFAWLFFNLLATFSAVFVIKNFEDTIQKFALLAALMPVVASMGGCSGTQSLATAVRAIAMKKLTLTNAFRSTGREVLVGFINGIIFSLLSFIITYYFFNDLILSYIISFSLLMNLTFGAFFGTFIPIMLTRFGMDPAFASGALLMTVTDILGFFLFLGLATIFLI